MAQVLGESGRYVSQEAVRKSRQIWAGCVIVIAVFEGIRLEKSLPSGAHRLTIPNHNPLKVGTLSGILKNIGGAHGLSVEQLLAELKL